MRIIIKSDKQKDYAIDLIKKLKYEPWHTVDINKYEQDRSLEQNNLLHAWCLDASRSHRESTGEYYTPDAWKEHFKKLFLGFETVQTPSGNIDRLKSTKKLSMKNFAKLLTNIEHYCGEHQIKLRIPIEYNWIINGKT